MLTYLAVRFGLALLLPFSGAMFGTLLEMLFWLGLGVYAIVLGVRFASRRVKSPRHLRAATNPVTFEP